MDVDLLSKMVKELILDNEEVSLPGLGTFVSELVPSAFSDKGYTINPPYRRLAFRQRNVADSMLADFYSRSNGTDLDMAGKIVAEFTNELKNTLQSKKVVALPGLGRLRATRENAFFFIPDADLDIYPEGFGLEPVSLKTHEETAEEVSAAVVGLKAILQEPVALPFRLIRRRRKLRRRRKAALVALAILIGSVVLFRPVPAPRANRS